MISKRRLAADLRVKPSLDGLRQMWRLCKRDGICLDRCLDPVICFNGFYVTTGPFHSVARGNGLRRVLILLIDRLILLLMVFFG